MAENEGLVAALDYEPKFVRWIISLSLRGSLVGLISTVSVQPGEAKPIATIMQIPRRVNRKSENRPNFLIDTPEYVLGLLCSDSASSKARLRRAETRRLSFLSKIEDAARMVRNSPLDSVARFLKSGSHRQRAISLLQQQGCASFELICFKVGERLIHDMPGIQAYFSSNQGAVQTENICCMICGKTGPAEHNHPTIQLRGGSPVGNVLVSFNVPASESRGWHRHENAPICANCAKSYITALRRLTSTRYPNPYDAGKMLPSRYIGLTQDTTAVFWVDSQNEQLDLFTDIFENPNSEAATLGAKSAWLSGTSAVPGEFHCLLISGGRGRAVLRGSLHLPFHVVKANVKEFYSLLVQLCDQPIPLFRLLRSLVDDDGKEDLPPSLACDLFSAILCGIKFPRSLLMLNTTRCRIDCHVSQERAFLLHIFFLRNRQRQELIMGLNRKLTDTAYRLGRLLAVLERQQCVARHQVKRTIADRYYASASTRPGSVFPMLIRLSRGQLSSANASTFLQREISEVLEAVPSFPARLSLEEQGLFALGFYHQRTAYYQRNEDTVAIGEGAPSDSAGGSIEEANAD